jgi:hypothetical protein
VLGSVDRREVCLYRKTTTTRFAGLASPNRVRHTTYQSVLFDEAGRVVDWQDH